MNCKGRKLQGTSNTKTRIQKKKRKRQKEKQSASISSTTQMISQCMMAIGPRRSHLPYDNILPPTTKTMFTHLNNPVWLNLHDLRKANTSWHKSNDEDMYAVKLLDRLLTTANEVYLPGCYMRVFLLQDRLLTTANEVYLPTYIT